MKDVINPDFQFNGSLVIKDLKMYLHKVTMDKYGMDPFKKTRLMDYVKLRQSLIYVLATKSNLRLNQISNICGQLTHSTIIHSVKKASYGSNDPLRMEYVSFYYTVMVNFLKEDFSTALPHYLRYLDKVRVLKHSEQEMEINNFLKKLIIEYIS